MDISNISREKWQTLWCLCGGGSRDDFESNLESLHENIWVQGLIYVGCVVSFYVTGVVAILMQSGKKFSSTSSGRFCVDIVDCRDAIMDRRREKRINRAKRKKAEKDMEMRGIHPKGLEEDSGSPSPIKTPVIKVTNDASFESTPASGPKTSSDSLLSIT